MHEKKPKWVISVPYILLSFGIFGASKSEKLLETTHYSKLVEVWTTVQLLYLGTTDYFKYYSDRREDCLNL